MLKKHDRELLDGLKTTGQIPRHIAVIMDGNGRWAKKRGLPRVAGHKKGILTVREIVEACAFVGVEYLTLYTFSTENWNRPQEEVSYLMRLVVKSLKDETDELHKNGIRLTTIGDISHLPQVVQNELNEAFEKTKDNKRMVLNLALSYSGRSEIVSAVKQIVAASKTKGFEISSINEETISNFLFTRDMPDPDLMIRSGGEFRISNFLLWQLAYSELFVTDVLWPDFKCKHLIESIKDFQRRERRFGLVSEQIRKNHPKKSNVKIHSKQIAQI
ncbi:MAG: isoprenyl transferase [Bacteroidetes bacterium]|nr:isoprenyl transferase [Bacteroidota bacterium]